MMHDIDSTKKKNFYTDWLTDWHFLLFFYSVLIFAVDKKMISLIKEHREAKKKMNEVDDAKKTFLKIQIPKMEKEIKSLKEEIEELLEEDELDPRGEYFVLATQLCN